MMKARMGRLFLTTVGTFGLGIVFMAVVFAQESLTPRSAGGLGGLGGDLSLLGQNSGVSTSQPTSGSGQNSLGFTPATSAQIEAMKYDIRAQRAHIWNYYKRLLAPTEGGAALFETMYSSKDTFYNRVDQAPDNHPLTEAAGCSWYHKASGPVDAQEFELYDRYAFNHIRTNKLFLTTRLDRLRTSTGTVPDFPTQSFVLKTKWKSLHPGDPALPELKRHYYWASITENRVPKVVLLEALHITTREHPNWVWATLWHSDAKPAGRTELRPSLKGQDGKPAEGALLASYPAMTTTSQGRDFFQGFPEELLRSQYRCGAGDANKLATGVFQYYAMDTCFDYYQNNRRPPETSTTNPRLPANALICWNPYLEFPAGGQVSNCMSCHQAARYPSNKDAADFMPYLYGHMDPGGKAYLARFRGNVKPSFQWAICFHARAPQRGENDRAPGEPATPSTTGTSPTTGTPSQGGTAPTTRTPPTTGTPVVPGSPSQSGTTPTPVTPPPTGPRPGGESSSTSGTMSSTPTPSTTSTTPESGRRRRGRVRPSPLF